MPLHSDEAVTLCPCLNHSSHRLCPLNNFCSAEARTDCLDTILQSCQHCNVSINHWLSVVYFVIGIAIFVGNVVIICVYLYRHFKKIVIKSDPIRLSLAIADLFTSFQIFSIVLPDLLHSLNITAREHFVLLHSRSDAWKCGVFVIFCFSASLYHLLLFGVQRLYAITNPMSYRKQSLKSVYIGLALVWGTAIFTASIPGLFPKYYYYCRRSNLCFVCSPSLTAYVALYSIFLFLPFFAMTAMSVFTAFVAKKKLSSRCVIRQASIVSEQGRKAFARQQVSAFKTVAIMQVGFSLSVGPSLVGVLLSNFGIECHFLDVYETICFVLYFSNSIVNVVVYSIRDEKFRETAYHLLRIIQLTKCFCRTMAPKYYVSRTTLHPPSEVYRKSLSLKLSLSTAKERR